MGEVWPEGDGRSQADGREDLGRRNPSTEEQPADDIPPPNLDDRAIDRIEDQIRQHHLAVEPPPAPHHRHEGKDQETGAEMEELNGMKGTVERGPSVLA